MVQRFFVHKPEEASPICPGKVALLAEDGGALLGALPKLGDKATAAQAREAYNALVDALVKAGLAYEEVK